MSTTATLEADYGLFSPNAANAWLDSMIESDVAAEIVGVTPNQMVKRFQSGWCKCGRNGKRFFTTRRWVRDALLRGCGGDQDAADDRPSQVVEDYESHARKFQQVGK